MTWADIVAHELRKCTDCGLCLSSCPTYTITHAEGDSPRGRMHLLDRALTWDDPDAVSAHHLDGCIECGACHAPCPTGVRVAFARQAHRSATQRLDRLAFERRVAELAGPIERDVGARLTIDAVRDLLDVAADTDSAQSTTGSLILVFGPMLRRAAPAVVDELETRLSTSAPALIHDTHLVLALERAGGLLRDVGLLEEHDNAVADVANLINARVEHPLTVAVFDQLFLRLREMPLPATVKVIAAHEIFATPSAASPRSAIWDHPAENETSLPSALPLYDVLPAEHDAAGAPVLLSAPALEALDKLLTAKRTWLAKRALVTMDARALLRFPGSRHLAEFVAPPPESTEQK